jgi:hypothetical protein
MAVELIAEVALIFALLVVALLAVRRDEQTFTNPDPDFRL